MPPDIDGWSGEFRRFVEAVRRRFGCAPRRIIVDLYDADVVLALPMEGSARAPGKTEASEPAAPGDGWAAGPELKCSADGSRIWHPRLGEFRFRPGSKMAIVIRLLADAWQASEPDVRERELLDEAESESDTVRDLFKRHPGAVLIVQGEEEETLRLAPIEDEQ